MCSRRAARVIECHQKGLALRRPRATSAPRTPMREGSSRNPRAAFAPPPSHPLASSHHHVRPLRHSDVHRFAHWSFQDGTECGMLHTLRWHASVHASVPEEPHTVTHVFGVGSC